jgi:hypothetical protein
MAGIAAPQLHKPARHRAHRLLAAASSSAPASPLAQARSSSTTPLDLVQWALKRNVKYSTIRPKEEEATGSRGVFATFPISAGEALSLPCADAPLAQHTNPHPAVHAGGATRLAKASPPRPRPPSPAGQALVSVPRATALSTHPGEPCPFPQQLPEASWQALPWYGKLAAKLLAEATQGGASQLATFVQLLPAAVDLPALWSREQLAQLHNPALAQKVRGAGARRQRACRAAAPGLPGPLV